MKKINEIDVLAISGVVLPFIVFFFDIKCIFKKIFHIPCISCGLTRGFIAILHLRFIDAIKYNILSIPLFIVIVAFYILYFLKLLFKIDYITDIYNYFSKYYRFLIIILFMCWVLNIFIVKYLI